MTKAELVAALANFPDDIKIIVEVDDGYESRMADAMSVDEGGCGRYKAGVDGIVWNNRGLIISSGK